MAPLQAYILIAAIGASHEDSAGDTPGMGWPALEEIDQRSNAIGEIDARIAIEIIQADLAGPIAGQVRRLTKEEMAQETDPIREIEAAIAIAITTFIIFTNAIINFITNIIAIYIEAIK